VIGKLVLPLGRCAFLAGAVLAVGVASAEAIAGGAGPARALPTVGHAAVDARVLAVSVVPRYGGRRGIVAEFKADERITVELRVIRYQSVIARSKVFKLCPGRWIYTMAIAANVGAGRARVAVRMEDSAHNVARYRQPIRIPPRR
jgi:hypothetical protein